jgi:osmotically-inducible protein OsmY
MRLIVAGLTLCLLVGVAGCSTGGTQAVNDIHSLSDQKLATEVYRRIRDDMVHEEALSIGVTATGSVVTLHGSVVRPEARARAQAIAQGTPGVAEVVNEITTKF